MSLEKLESKLPILKAHLFTIQTIAWVITEQLVMPKSFNLDLVRGERQKSIPKLVLMPHRISNTCIEGNPNEPIII